MPQEVLTHPFKFSKDCVSWQVQSSYKPESLTPLRQVLRVGLEICCLIPSKEKLGVGFHSLILQMHFLVHFLELTEPSERLLL